MPGIYCLLPLVAPVRFDRPAAFEAAQTQLGVGNGFGAKWEIAGNVEEIGTDRSRVTPLMTIG